MVDHVLDLDARYHALEAGRDQFPDEESWEQACDEAWDLYQRAYWASQPAGAKERFERLLADMHDAIHHNPQMLMLRRLAHTV